jgi:hypothetical protein
MNVIHFTHGATDRLTAFGSKDVCFVPLADGNGESLSPTGLWVREPV